MTDKQNIEMTDEQFMMHAYRNNSDAVRLAMELRHVSHALDDLVDKDKPITDEQVRATFWRALIVLPANPFYAEHLSFLHPLMAAALVNWQIANVFEKCGEEERNMAHSLRYDIATVFVMIAYLVGGRVWAESVGPEIRRRTQRETLAAYLDELKKKDQTEASNG